jgi:hypothetical protein
MVQPQRDRATREKALLSGDLLVALIDGGRCVGLPLW